MQRDHLVRRFADAGLTLVLSNRPLIGLGRGASDIVQIDIQRAGNGRRHEWFRIYPGADDNRIEVVGTDKEIGQLVLMVHEPPRDFEENVPWSRFMDLHGQPDWIATLARNLGVRSDAIIPRYGRGTILSVSIRRRTPGNKRHFLCGLDERQLFIAQLTRGCSTVREAHASLKTTTVSVAEGQGIKAVRQGEWFFLEATQAELQEIEVGIKKNRLTVETNVPIGPFSVVGGVRGTGKVRQFRGNPHTADELVVVPNTFSVRGRELFIRGRVRHVDHATVKFSSWVRVIRNSEANAGQALGVGWVD